MVARLLLALLDGESSPDDVDLPLELLGALGACSGVLDAIGGIQLVQQLT